MLKRVFFVFQILIFLFALSCASPRCAMVFADDEAVYYETREEAGKGLRKALKKRQGMVSVGVYEDVNKKTIKSIISDVFEKALEHTGVPNEGDYLRYQYKDYSGKAESTWQDGRPAVIIRYVIHYYTDATQEKAVDEKVDEILSELAMDDMTSYEKTEAIHEYIVDNTGYDSNGKGTLRHSAYAALVKGHSVCQGYALAMYRLLLESGVDCRVIFGKGVEPNGKVGDHAWNIVKIGSDYFYVDSTWDDSLGTDSYYLCNRNEFEGDHKMDKEYGEAFITEEYPVSKDGEPIDTEKPILQLVKAAGTTTEGLEEIMKRKEEALKERHKNPILKYKDLAEQKIQELITTP